MLVSSQKHKRCMHPSDPPIVENHISRAAAMGLIRSSLQEAEPQRSVSPYLNSPEVVYIILMNVILAPRIYVILITRAFVLTSSKWRPIIRISSKTFPCVCVGKFFVVTSDFNELVIYYRLVVVVVVVLVIDEILVCLLCAEISFEPHAVNGETLMSSLLNSFFFCFQE